MPECLLRPLLQDGIERLLPSEAVPAAVIEEWPVHRLVAEVADVSESGG